MTSLEIQVFCQTNNLENTRNRRRNLDFCRREALRPATRGGGQAEVELAPVVPREDDKDHEDAVSDYEDHDDKQLAPVVPGVGNIVMMIIMVRIVVIWRWRRTMNSITVTKVA